MSDMMFADFNNADEKGRVRLNAQGTIADLKERSMSLSAGQRLEISDGEIQTEGIVEFSEDEQIWVVRIDWPED